VYAQQERLCQYFDMPMQHASDRLLRTMKRGYTQRTLCRLLDDIRQRMPEATIRSTFIVGFPGETPADVETLLQFLEQAQLDRVGVFTYSREEGTPSYDLTGQVPAREAARRRREVMALQQEISWRKHQALVGQQLWAMVDEDATETHPAVGRLASQAPEIDGVVSIDGPVTSGELVLVEITKAEAYDFTAHVVQSAPSPALVEHQSVGYTAASRRNQRLAPCPQRRAHHAPSTACLYRGPGGNPVYR